MDDKRKTSYKNKHVILAASSKNHEKYSKYHNIHETFNTNFRVGGKFFI